MSVFPDKPGAVDIEQAMVFHAQRFGIRHHGPVVAHDFGAVERDAQTVVILRILNVQPQSFTLDQGIFPSVSSIAVRSG